LKDFEKLKFNHDSYEVLINEAKDENYLKDIINMAINNSNANN
jgi:hypothetical protein